MNSTVEQGWQLNLQFMSGEVPQFVPNPLSNMLPVMRY